MASIILPRLLFLSLLFHSILLVKCDNDEEDTLLRGINQYRASLNLTALTENEQVECLADEVADTFNNQPCTSTSGPNGLPGSEPQLSSYPNILTKCRLDANMTQGAQILPVCVPRLEPGLVLSNYTMSRYANFLNNSRFSNIGISTEDDWIVVVLTMSTPTGSFTPGTGNNNGSFTPGSGNNNPVSGSGSGSSNPNNGASGLVAVSPIVFLLIGFFVLF